MKKRNTRANIKQMSDDKGASMMVGGATPMPTSVQQSSPAPSPNYVPPTPMPPPATQTMADGGESKSSDNAPSRYDGIRSFFADVNIVDIAISAFLVAGITYIVYYYKYMLKLEKTGYADLSDRMMKLESAIAAREAQLNAAGNMNRKKRPLMRLG